MIRGNVIVNDQYRNQSLWQRRCTCQNDSWRTPSCPRTDGSRSCGCGADSDSFSSGCSCRSAFSRIRSTECSSYPQSPLPVSGCGCGSTAPAEAAPKCTNRSALPSCGCQNAPTPVTDCSCQKVPAPRGCCEDAVALTEENALFGKSLAMVYSPHQCFRELYDPKKGLCSGTVFSELHKPFHGGNCR